MAKRLTAKTVAPHKEEGDDFAAIVAKTVKDQRLPAVPQSPPPPCGEGSGVGVASNEVPLASPVAAIKIGMLGTAAAIDAVASVMANCPQVPVVLDPVLASTSGRALLGSDAIDTLRRKLMPLCTLITPNLPELALLTGSAPAHDEDEIIRQGQALLDAGARAVLAKGGHATGEQSTDLLLRPGLAPMRFEAPRVAATMRGTGCMLASAIAAQLARGETLETSVLRAKHYVLDRLRSSHAARPER